MTDRKFIQYFRRQNGILPNRSRIRAAFTLIEILVVIAIISILVALLFPVFASVLENSRESNTMSNMATIQSALALYELDNKRYPDVLFAYAKAPGATSADTCSSDMSSIGAAGNCSGELVGLYPTYVKDWHVFLNPNDNVTDTTATVTVPVNQFSAANGRTMTTPAPSATYFKMDSLDVSPQITGVNQLSASNYIVRYQTSWTDYTPTTPSTSPSSNYSTLCFPDGSYANGSCETSTSTTTDPNYDPDYSRQLRWSNPPPDTYVTSVTDHVPNSNRVIVLYLDGTVKKVNIQNEWEQVPSQGGLSTSGFQPSSANYSILEQSFNDSQTDIGAMPIQGVTVGTGAVNESKAGFWRTKVGRGEQ